MENEMEIVVPTNFSDDFDRNVMKIHGNLLCIETVLLNS